MNTKIKTEQDVINWFCDNGPTIEIILNDMNKAKAKLLEIEPVVFHDDIIEEFYDLTIQKIIQAVTERLAISPDLVYNTIEDKKLLVDSLNRSRV